MRGACCTAGLVDLYPSNAIVNGSYVSGERLDSTIVGYQTVINNSFPRWSVNEISLIPASYPRIGSVESVGSGSVHPIDAIHSVKILSVMVFIVRSDPMVGNLVSTCDKCVRGKHNSQSGMAHRFDSKTSTVASLQMPYITTLMVHLFCIDFWFQIIMVSQRNQPDWFELSPCLLRQSIGINWLHVIRFHSTNM